MAGSIPLPSHSSRPSGRFVHFSSRAAGGDPPLIVPQAGITHVFVNLGSDHPSIIEAIVKGQNEQKGQFPRVITCPNEVCSVLHRAPRKS